MIGDDTLRGVLGNRRLGVFRGDSYLGADDEGVGEVTILTCFFFETLELDSISEALDSIVIGGTEVVEGSPSVASGTESDGSSLFVIVDISVVGAGFPKIGLFAAARAASLSSFVRIVTADKLERLEILRKDCIVDLGDLTMGLFPDLPGTELVTEVGVNPVFGVALNDAKDKLKSADFRGDVFGSSTLGATGEFVIEIEITLPSSSYTVVRGGYLTVFSASRAVDVVCAE